MLLSEIVEIINGKLIGEDVEIEEFTIDSRQNGLFFALQGNRDGHDFARSPAVVKRDLGLSSQIIVDDPKLALGKLASYIRKKIPLVIGITGSAGKTTVKNMVAKLLEDHNILYTEGNFNNDLGLPLTLLRYKDQDIVILELGINHIGEMDYLVEIAKPDIACITSILPAHLEGLKTLENVRKEKEKIFKHAKHKISFENLTEIQNIEIQNIKLSLLGKHNFKNAQLAIEIVKCIEQPKVEKLQDLKPIKGRLYPFYKNGKLFIDDTYNANSESIRIAVDILKEYPKPLLVLGDLSECLDPIGQHELLKYLENEVDIISFGKYCKSVGLGKNFENKQDIADFINNSDFETILVKGSRSMKMEEIFDLL